MAATDPVSELHQRLDDLEEQIARLRSGNRLGAEQQSEGEAIEAKAQGLRRKLAGARGATWDDVKHELHEEWDALVHSVERWGERIDRRFGKR